MRSTKWEQHKTNIKVGLAIAGVALSAKPAMQVISHAPLELLGTPAFAQTLRATPQVVQSTDDLVNRWTPSENLYVQGEDNVGLGDAELRELATWLKSNHPNYTVFLIGDANNEEYSDSDGTKYGYEAVEYQLSARLMNTAKFRAQLDHETGLPNGTVLCICFDPHEVGWSSSPYQDKLGLDDESNWKEDIDQIAINNLRDGLRVTQAVQETIAEIESRVAQKQEEARAAAEQLKNNAIASVPQGQRQLALLGEELEAFRAKYPHIKTSLAYPNLGALQNQLELASDGLKLEKYESALSKVQRVEGQIQQIRENLTEYPGYTKKFEELSGSIAAAKKHEFAKPHLAAVRQAERTLAQARNEWATGDPSYRRDFNAAERSVQDATSAMKRDALLDTAKRGALDLTGLGLIVAAGVTLRGKNRSRRRVKEEAEARFELLTTALAEKTEALLELDKQAGIYLEGATYKGETQALQAKVLKNMPALYTMITCADTVIDRARPFVQPGPVGKVRNTFSKANYEQALRLLDDEPVVFDETTNLSEAISGPKLSSYKLWADLKAFEPFSLSFDDLIDTFNERAQETLDALDQISRATEWCGDRLSRAQTMLGKLDAAANDSVPHISLAGLTEPVAVLKKERERLQSEWVTDPVGYVNPTGEIATKVKDLSEFTTSVTILRNSPGKEIEELKAQLEKAGYRTEWIDTRLQEIGVEVSSYLAKAATGGVEQPNLEESFKALLDDVTRAVSFADIIAVKVPETMQQAKKEAEDARSKVCMGAGIISSQALKEAGAEPEPLLKEAQDLAGEARNLLSEGKVAESEEKLKETKTKLDSIRQIAADSVVAVENFQKRSAEVSEALAQAEEILPESKKSLDDIKSRYAPSVLALGAGDAAHPNANGTVDDNILEASDALEKTKQALAEAQRAFQSGGVLHAMQLLEQSQGLIDISNHRCGEIEEKKERLAATEVKNATLADQLVERTQLLAAEVIDKRVTVETEGLFNEAKAKFEKAEARAARERDPFAREAALIEAERAYATIENHIRQDRGNFSHAGEAIEGSRRELSRIQNDLNEIAQENVRESADLVAAERELSGFVTELQAIQRVFEEERADWADVARQADRLIRKGHTIYQQVHTEAEEIDDALEKMKSAEHEIAAARSFRGSYGVTVDGAPGQTSLRDAQSYLSQGLYEEAIRSAASAYSKAHSAIEEAESEVRRLKREEEEREAEERRRRQREEDDRRRRSSYSSYSSSSSSSWSSGSGMSSSSFGGGSGMSSSSW